MVSLKFQEVVEDVSLYSEQGEPAAVGRNIRGKIHLKTLAGNSLSLQRIASKENTSIPVNINEPLTRRPTVAEVFRCNYFPRVIIRVQPVL
jgi:hypothetical protein